MQYLFVGLLGLAVGSFLNSVIFRLEQGKSALQGRSSCPSCGHMLAWQDLVPLLSFVLLQGRCRYCKQKISLQYPLVELATGILFLLIFNFQLSIFNEFSIAQFLNLLYLWIVSALLIAIFVYDLKHFIIPDRFVYSALGITFAYRIFESLNLFRISDFGFRISLPLTQAVLSGLVAGAFFFAIYLASRGRAMGFGDVKLTLFMGLFLGWPNILVALFLAFFLGAAVGILLVLSSKKKWKSQVPFGPFLITGTFIALFLGENLTRWYLNLVLV